MVAKLTAHVAGRNRGLGARAMGLVDAAVRIFSSRDAVVTWAWLSGDILYRREEFSVRVLREGSAFYDALRARKGRGGENLRRCEVRVWLRWLGGSDELIVAACEGLHVDGGELGREADYKKSC